MVVLSPDFDPQLLNDSDALKRAVSLNLNKRSPLLHT